MKCNGHKIFKNNGSTQEPSIIILLRATIVLLDLVTICISYKVLPSMVNQLRGECAKSSTDFRRLKKLLQRHISTPTHAGYGAIQAESELKNFTEVPEALQGTHRKNMC